MAGTLGTLKVKDSTGAWVNIAGRGPIGPQGEIGPAGEPFVIVDSFGVSKEPVDFPIDGVIPVDWDEPGKPTYTMRLGSALYYDPTDPYLPGAGHLYEFVDTADPTGWVDVGQIRGPQGTQGISSVIVGDFGAITTPADLPIDGLIPIDWDGVGNPPVAYQMELGQSLYYDKPTDPIDGHLFQYIGVSIDPSGWLDIGLIQGPTGPAGPQGDPGVGLDEVFVGPVDPIATVPSADVWYDTLAPEPPPVGMPDYALSADVVHKANIYSNGNFGGPWDLEGSADTIIGMVAGDYLLICGCSGLSAAAGARTCEVKIDGVVVATIRKWFNSLNTHEFLGVTCATVVGVTAGDHTVGFQAGANLNSDVNDYGFIVLIPVGG